MLSDTIMRMVERTYVRFLSYIKGDMARQNDEGFWETAAVDVVLWVGGGAVGGHIHSTLEIKGRTVGSPMTKIVDMHVGNRILRER